MPQLTLPVYQKQKDFLDSQARFRAFAGGRGCGKSMIGSYDLLKRAKPGRLYMVGGPTYPMLEDATIRSLRAVARHLGVEKSFRAGTAPLMRLNNGAEIIIRSADDPERFRGPNLSGIWIDEASQVSEDAFNISIACLRQGEFGQIAEEMGWLTATFTPKGRQHWTYPKFARRDDNGNYPPHTYLVQARTKDNPFLPADFEETIRAQVGSIMAAQELNGEFVDFEGALIKREWFRYWTREGESFYLLHKGRDREFVDPKLCRYFITVDLATSIKTTADFTVIAVWADDRKGRLILADVHRARMEGPDIVPAIQRKMEQFRCSHVSIESTGFQLSMVQAARRLGLPVRELKADKDKVSRVLTATVRMEAGQVFFPQRASWLLDWEDELLQFPSDADGVHDDCVDALAYAAREMTNLYAAQRSFKPYVLGQVPRTENPYNVGRLLS